jgi:hypothetical protein
MAKGELAQSLLEPLLGIGVQEFSSTSSLH